MEENGVSAEPLPLLLLEGQFESSGDVGIGQDTDGTRIWMVKVKSGEEIFADSTSSFTERTTAGGQPGSQPKAQGKHRPKVSLGDFVFSLD